ncbi:hypothetical protein BSLG_005952, partial [Batrachochytrium salamandrivorans]
MHESESSDKNARQQCCRYSIVSIGIFLANVLPRGILNPGPFTIKGTFLYMIAGAAGGQPYGVENVIGQKFDQFMGDSKITFWNSILFLVSYFLATALQSVSVLCMITNSKSARFLGSASPDAGMNSFVFHFGNPVLEGSYTFEDGTPFPVLNSPALYNSQGKPMRATSMYDRNNFNLNKTAYDLVKPIYLTEYFCCCLLHALSLHLRGISHVALWYYKDIIRQTKEMFNQVDRLTDIHNELMKAYPDIPEWMYMVWLTGLVVMLLVGSSGQQLGLNIITELLMGLFIPGQTVAVMTFKIILLWETIIGAFPTLAAVWIAIATSLLVTKIGHIR